ncbi:MAG: hypothetical protein JSS97_21050 [Actinobacteria bacterium]|nr:hypothetical protein [Actinomycetota bacterium]
MNKRTLVPAVSLLAAALVTLAACGGGSSDEGKIAATIETAATTSEPSNCTELKTRRFVEQNSAKKGTAAVETCEAEAREGKNLASSATVSNVSVDGGKATAQVAFKGGSLGSQAVEVGLVEEGGSWKLDHIEGFADYDGKALGEHFEKRFEEEGELSPRQIRCITGKIAGLSQAEAEEAFFGGATEQIIKLAKSCV